MIKKSVTEAATEQVAVALDTTDTSIVAPESTAIAKTRGEQLKVMVDRMKSRIAQSVTFTPAETFQAGVLTAFTKNPKLIQCTDKSITNSILQAAQIDLIPNTALGHAYLVPYSQDCQLIIGYRGLIELARRSGQILSLKAVAVYTNDVFKYEYGKSEDLHHVPAHGDRGELKCVYAYAHLKGGGFDFEVMSIADVNKIRDRARFRNPVWDTDFDEMAKKTVLRRLMKRLPASIQMAQAIEAEDRVQYGETHYEYDLADESANN